MPAAGADKKYKQTPYEESSRRPQKGPQKALETKLRNKKRPSLNGPVSQKLENERDPLAAISVSYRRGRGCKTAEVF